MKKRILTALACAASLPVFAQDNTSTIDLSAASTAVTSMSDAVTGFITGDLLTALLAVIGAGVVIWVVFLAWKFIKRGGQRAG